MSLNSKPRIAIGGLALSAAALVALVADEGWAPVATIPTTGDVPTVGFGSTTNLDGTPVRLGATTNPVAALQRTLAYTQVADAKIKRCVTAPLHQAEFDLMNDFGYQYGVGALCKSSIVALANAGDYAGSCKAYLRYRFAAGYDCSTPGNKRCAGVWARQKSRFDKCMEAQ